MDTTLRNAETLARHRKILVRMLFKVTAYYIVLAGAVALAAAVPAPDGGVIEPPRNLLHQVASGFVETKDHGTMNWCCGGGGGVSANERAEPLRVKVFNRKKKQFEELGVKTVITACANCRIVLEEGLEHYDMMDTEVIGLTELLAEHLPESRAAGE